MLTEADGDVRGTEFVSVEVMTLAWDVALLLAVAALFAFVSGMNDGASLLAMVGRNARRRGLLLIVLAAAVVVVPLVVTDAVGATLAVRLVGFDDADAAVAPTIVLAVAVLAGLIVVAVLSRQGTPTSLTLALIGGILGAALTTGLPVNWAWVLLTIGVAVAAPPLAATIAWVLAAAQPLSGQSMPSATVVRYASTIGFLLLVGAYASNDGQKLIAIVAVALGTPAEPAAVGWSVLGAAGLLFLVGALVGAHRVSATLANKVVLARAPHVMIAQFGASSAVFASSALLAPVSMTQSIAGALVGATGSVGWRRVRWRAALEVLVAWLVTLPLAAVLGALGGAAVSGLARLTT